MEWNLFVVFMCFVGQMELAIVSPFKMEWRLLLPIYRLFICSIRFFLYLIFKAIQNQYKIHWPQDFILSDSDWLSVAFVCLGFQGLFLVFSVWRLSFKAV